MKILDRLLSIVISKQAIFLDEEMNAKIADFGMVRLVLVDLTQANTSRIVRTSKY